MYMEILKRKKVDKMGIWDKIKDALGITQDSNTAESNIEQTEETEAEEIEEEPESDAT